MMRKINLTSQKTVQKTIFIILLNIIAITFSLHAQDVAINSDEPTTPTPSEEKKDNQDTASKETSSKKKKGPNLGLSIALDNTAEGYQRVSFAPEFRIGKFGMGIDIELFIDLQKGDVSSRGWEFNEATTVDNILRKIKYISWSTRNEVLFGKDYVYFKFGILNNVTLGTGLIFNDFNNSFYYPDRKPLGLNLVLNGQKLLPAGVELFVSDFSEFNSVRIAPIIGGRLFYNFVGNAQLGISLGLDANQLNAIKDSDGDTYPDVFDSDPFDSTVYSEAHLLEKQLIEYGYSDDDITDIISRGEFEDPYSLENQQDSFSIIGVDVIISLLRDLQLYGHVGWLSDDEDGTATEGIGLGIGGIFSPLGDFLRFQAEYRMKEKNFRFAWFNKNYESVRAQIIKDEIITLDNANIVTTDELFHGIFTKLRLSIFNVVDFVSSYEMLVLEGQDNEQKLFLDLGLNPQFAKNLPVIHGVNLFYENSRIMNLEQDFTTNNPYLFYGYTIGFDLGGTIVTILQRFGFTYNGQGEIVEDSKLFIGMEAKF